MKIKEFGSEFDWQSNAPYLRAQEKDCFEYDNVLKFRSGRDALKAVARECKDKTQTVLLPALCCESMVSPFLMNGYKVVFYKVNPDYTADQNDLESKMEQGCVLLYMAYFGIQPIEEGVLKLLKERYNAILLEDRTQNALHKIPQPNVADFIVISIRKWIAIPDGGILISKERIQKRAEKDEFFATVRQSAMKLKSQYLLTGDQRKKDEFREQLNQANHALDKSEMAFDVYGESEKLLAQLDFDKILKDRQKNVIILKHGLMPLAYQGKISFITNQPELSTLYFPIIISDRDRVQGELAKKGIYCPVIWPVPEQAKGVCAVAEKTAEKMLAIPCDQRYGEQDMKFIVEQVIKTIDA